MNDAELIELLLEAVKQDDKKKYLGFSQVRSNRNLSTDNIAFTSDSFDENYKQVKDVLDDAGVDKQHLRYLRGKILDGGYFTELSTLFDLYNGPLTGFLASILAIIILIDNGGPEGIWWVKASLSAAVLGAASFSLFRRSQTNAQKIRLLRLKNYLDIYLENYDLYQEEVAQKTLIVNRVGIHATSHN